MPLGATIHYAVNSACFCFLRTVPKVLLPVTLYDNTESKVLTRCGNYRALLSLYVVPTTRSLFEASDVLRSVRYSRLRTDFRILTVRCTYVPFF